MRLIFQKEEILKTDFSYKMINQKIVFLRINCQYMNFIRLSKNYAYKLSIFLNHCYKHFRENLYQVSKSKFSEFEILTNINKKKKLIRV